ncbi:MAG: hypothetical protein Q9186_001168 [Xanthomendoza sp. 1 TL-2023]
MLAITFIGILVLSLALLYKYVLEPAFFSPLAKLPVANFWSTISSQWIEKRRADGRETQTIFALHQKYGSIVRLGPKEISVNSQDGLRIIYLGGFEKHHWYADVFVNYMMRNMFTMLDRKAHSVRKRHVSNLYSKSYLDESVDLHLITIDLILHKFLPAIDAAACDNHPIDMFDLLQALGMDFITAYHFGSANGARFLEKVEYRRHWFETYATFSRQSPKERANGEIEQWCMAMCKAAEDEMHPEKFSLSTQPVVYGKLLQCLRANGADPQQLSKMAGSEALDHIIAGHETSAITVTYLMYEMSQRFSLQNELRQELQTLSCPLRYPRGSDATRGEDELPAAKDIDKLPLLNAILQETLRHHSAGLGPQPRVTPDVPGGSSIEGYNNIPGGIRVSSNPYSVHRIAEVFPEPDVWLPERWLTADEKKLEQMKRCFFAFGAGGRMCVGSNFAMKVMKLAAAAVYTNYTTFVAEESDMEQVDSQQKKALFPPPIIKQGWEKQVPVQYLPTAKMIPLVRRSKWQIYAFPAFRFIFPPPTWTL